MFSDYISIIALIISALSMGVSWYFSNRDKAKLRTSADLYSTENDEYIILEIINVGRRPTYITMFGSDLENGSWQASYLGEKDKGIRLEEHQKYQEKVEYKDAFVFFNKGQDMVKKTKFWYEDILGERHYIKNSDTLISRFY
jgi:hypothetical protein